MALSKSSFGNNALDVSEVLTVELIEKINPGDIVVIRTIGEINPQVMSDIRAAVRRVVPGDAKVIVLEKGLDIEVKRSETTSL